MQKAFIKNRKKLHLYLPLAFLVVKPKYTAYCIFHKEQMHLDH